ncbi:DUF2877 domain-containing protein [Thorsellia kenyensis]|uniref:DUF2877 domain-containing protein n=1 Tax=Thorsellia kenyensis TaxID=1549888 RepID=A0ABV6CBN8_9GAMM
MRIVDISNYVNLSEFKQLKVLACFSKAIYCMEVSGNKKIICFTPDRISLSSLSIRISDFDTLLAYCTEKMHENILISLELVDTTCKLDRRISLQTSEMKTKDCFLSLGNRWHINIFSEFPTAIYSDELSDEMNRISTIGLGKLLPILINAPLFDRFAKGTLNITTARASVARYFDALIDLALENRFINFTRKNYQHDSLNSAYLIEILSALRWLYLGAILKHEPYISTGLNQLIGHGEGLTPAGDDFIVGFIAGLRYFGQTELLDMTVSITHNIKENTNRISQAFLNSALEGYFSVALTDCMSNFARLLKTAAQVEGVKLTLNKMNEQEEFIASLVVLQKIGHSSGIDALVGTWFATLVIKRQ